MTDESDIPLTPAEGIARAADDIDLDGPVPGGSARDLAAVLGAQRAELEAALQEQQDKYLRLAAEFDNYRKRAVREREGAEHHGQGVVIRGLLDSLDDLARCVSVDPDATDAETVLAGVKLVEQKLLKSLAGHGLEVVDPLGHPFDPAMHEALTTAPAERAEDDHLVAMVYQVGYLFNGQLLRPARVVVKQWSA
jgi:molecular chaperone GrpE